VPERMAAAVPNARLIYVLRDPIERALSHYRHNVSHGRETRSVEDAFSDLRDNHYVATSRYWEQAERFLRFFDRDQLLFVDFSELRTTPNAVLERIFSFVDVDPTFRHDAFGTVLHDSSQKGRPNALGRRIATVPVVRQLRYAFPQVFEAPLDRPTLSASTHAALLDALGPDIEALRRESGLPLVAWTD